LIMAALSHLIPAIILVGCFFWIPKLQSSLLKLILLINFVY
jgi:hypothetical protein